MDYSIDAMHCDGCAKGVRAAIAEADPAAEVTIDLAARRARIDTRHRDAVLAGLAEAGFPAVPA